MSKYERIDIQTRWNKRECREAVTRLEHKIRYARQRLRNSRRYTATDHRYNTEYIIREIEEIKPVLLMWQERLAEYDNN